MITTRTRNRYLPMVFLVPIFVLLSIFRYYPLFSAIYHSFTKWNAISSKFVGFQNYVLLFQDSSFISSLWNIVVYTLILLIVTITMAIIGAELIFNLPPKWGSFWKYLFIVPMVVPYTVNILIWKFIYNPYLGILNRFLDIIGLRNFTFPWLGSSRTVLGAIAFVGFPLMSTLQFLIILSSLQSIDSSILDAAKIDGATVLKRIFKIDFPLIMDKILLAVMLTVIGAFQSFTNFFVLTGGGPGTSSLVPALYLYQTAFQSNSLGYACAIGVTIAIVSLTIVLVIQKIERKVIL